MTSTSHDDNQPETPDLESSNKPQAASTDDKGVPRGEHIELRQELRAAKEELDSLRKLIADSKDKNVNAAPQTQVTPDWAGKVRDLERRDMLRDIKVEMGLGTKQAETILSIMDKTPGLSREEARTLAVMRDPGLFEGEGGVDGFQPGVHGAARPRPGSAPAPIEEQVSDTLTRLETIKKLTTVDKRQAGKLYANLIGSIAAQQVKKPGHQRLPLPKLPQ